MDGIGWADGPADETHPDGVLMNEVWYNPADPESLRVANMYQSVDTDYGIGIGYRNTAPYSTSDEQAYYYYHQTAVSSLGGWKNYHPGYHGCADVMANVNPVNLIKSVQQTLAVGLRLDAESLPAPTIQLSLAPATVDANGTDTSIATATVTAPGGGGVYPAKP